MLAHLSAFIRPFSDRSSVIASEIALPATSETSSVMHNPKGERPFLLSLRANAEALVPLVPRMLQAVKPLDVLLALSSKPPL